MSSGTAILSLIRIADFDEPIRKMAKVITGLKRSRANVGLYETIMGELMRQISAGDHPVGTRLPAERQLAKSHNVSRGTVKKAITALEVRGLVEVRLGSGAYVLRLPGLRDSGGFDLTALELCEARLLFEGEAAALAASQITDEDMSAIDAMARELERQSQAPEEAKYADRAFHIAIARATHNQAVLDAIEHLWNLWAASPAAAMLRTEARTDRVQPTVAEHTAVLKALRTRDPVAARMAMRAHIGAALESLLLARKKEIPARKRDAGGASCKT
jgi:GntR family transcriptional regulator, hexuronate regulon transcriptional repressor